MLLLAVIFFLGDIAAARASQSVALTWDANTDPDVAGYRLYCGTTSGVYIQQIEVGNATTTLLSNLLDGTTYFFAVTAYSTSFVESSPSTEISYTVPSSNPSPTPTPGPSPTPTPLPTPTPSPSPTPTPSPSPTPTPTPLPTPVPTPSPHATPRSTPTPTSSPHATPRSTPTSTPTPFATPTPARAPKISVSAAPMVIKEGESATYTLTTSNINPARPTIVHYRLRGRAVLGTHYRLSSARGQISIPAGRSSATVRLTAFRTNLAQGSQTAKMILVTRTGYRVSAVNYKATVTISNTP